MSRLNRNQLVMSAMSNGGGNDKMEKYFSWPYFISFLFI